MFVVEPPEFVNRPPDEVLENEGGNLYLNCSVSGADDTIVAWYRQGIPDTIVVRQMFCVPYHV